MVLSYLDDLNLNEKEMISYHNGGMSTYSISKKMEIPYIQIQRVLVKNLCEGYTYKVGMFNETEEKEIKKKYEEGVRLDTLYKEYKSEINILKYLVAIGAKRKNHYNEEFFDKWTKNSSYLYGMLLADGSLSKPENKNGFWVRLSQVDRSIIDKIAEVTDHKGKIYKRKVGKSRIGHIIDFNGRRFHKRLTELGLGGNKTFSGEIPQTLPDKLFGDFLRGLFDGDGYVRKGGGNVTITTASEDLAIQLNNRLAENNIETSVLVEKTIGKSTIYRVNTTNYIETAKLYFLMYNKDNGLCIKYKKNRFLENKFVTMSLEKSAKQHNKRVA